jgi:hypothetical protein
MVGLALPAALCRHCHEMKHGDSNHILPFVPHSFTSRNAAAPGLILAVT